MNFRIWQEQKVQILQKNFHKVDLRCQYSELCVQFFFVYLTFFIAMNNLFATFQSSKVLISTALHLGISMIDEYFAKIFFLLSQASVFPQ